MMNSNSLLLVVERLRIFADGHIGASGNITSSGNLQIGWKYKFKWKYFWYKPTC